jgi:hypothetical protein
MSAALVVEPLITENFLFVLRPLRPRLVGLRLGLLLLPQVPRLVPLPLVRATGGGAVPLSESESYIGPGLLGTSSFMTGPQYEALGCPVEPVLVQLQVDGEYSAGLPLSVVFFEE